MSPLIVGSNSEGSEGRSDRLGLPVGTEDPTTAEAGDLYYKTDTNKIRYYDGTQWNDLAAGGGGGGGGSTYSISNSIRFNSATESHLTKSVGNVSTFTFSYWMKRHGEARDDTFVTESSTGFFYYVNTDGKIKINTNNGNIFESNGIYRDPSAWYHIVINNTGTHFNLFVNGVRDKTAALTTQLYSGNLLIGRDRTATAANHADFNLADVHFVDGQALGPASFGETDTYGCWQPKEFTGTSVNNGTTWSSYSSDPDSVKQGGNASALFAGSLTTGGITLSKTTTASNQWYVALNNVSITCHKQVSFWSGNGASTAAMRINGSDSLIVKATSTTVGWWTIDFTGTITKVELAYLDGTGSSNTYYALAIDGQILRDGVTETHAYGSEGFHLDFSDPANIGADASSNTNNLTPSGVALDPGNNTIYSNSVTYSPSEGQKAYRAFDGNLSTRTNTPLTSDGYVNFAFSPAISYTSSVRFYAYAANGYEITNYYSLNGGSETTFTGGSSGFNGFAWITAATGSGSMSSLRVRLTRGSNQQSSPSVFAIEVDGVILTDKNVSGYVTDSPTNGTASEGGDPGGSIVGNYAVLNPLNDGSSAITFNNGNRDFTSTGTGRGNSSISMRPGDGKFYCEFTCTSTTQYNHPGIYADSISPTTDSNRIVLRQDGNVYIDLSFDSNIGSFTEGDCIGMAFDADLRQLTYYKNGTQIGGPFQASTPPRGGGYYFHILTGSNSGCSGTFNFGQNKFKYAAPTGYKSLNTANLTDSAVLDPQSVFTVRTYTGNSGDGLSTTKEILTGFSPDMVLIKDRDGTNSFHLFDTIRGPGKRLLVDQDSVTESTANDTLTAFSGTDGFTLNGNNAVNDDGVNYCAWVWDASESNTTPSGGSIPSTCRVNATAGISVVSYTGTSNAGTVAHGLGKKPQMIWVKTRDGNNDWAVYHEYQGASSFGKLNLNDVWATSNNTRWNGVEPDATSFTVGTGSAVNDTGENFIAYCFTSIEGYSRVGEFFGNGTNDNVFVYTGFQPKFIMTRYSTSAGDWMILDTSRRVNGEAGGTLAINENNAEDNYYTSGQVGFSFLSNGFKVRHNGSPMGDSGRTVVYIAFAEDPFKKSRAFPCLPPTPGAR